MANSKHFPTDTNTYTLVPVPVEKTTDDLVVDMLRDTFGFGGFYLLAGGE